MPAVRTRIAPSPTGYLHIGNARAGLFSYLFAKKHHGVFVLRLEDTNRTLHKPEFEEDIYDAFDWLGISPDENPVAGGPYGPYRDSERGESHGRTLRRLLESGDAYYCPHTGAELEAEKSARTASGEHPVHICLHRNGEAREGIIRFKTPSEGVIRFQDLIRGEIAFESATLGDFSLAKTLATPLYNFAVVVDDHEMQISHVIRGEDHIPNTPKQMLIWRALWPDEPLPAFAHLPLILGPDRSKLSKRHGATSVRELREQGYLPDALVNFMALLGWNPGSERELYSLAELVEHFDLARVQKSGAVFNNEKLDWMNGEYIRRKTPAELARLAGPFLADAHAAAPLIERVVALEQPRLKKLSELGERTDYFFRDPEYPADLLRWKEMSASDAEASLANARAVIESIPEEDFTDKARIESAFSKAIGVGDKGRWLWPLRAALTGKRASPGPFEIMAILGKKQCLRRVERARKKLV